ncbi:MAG: MopE-related protein [Myxococcota bacterium]
MIWLLWGGCAWIGPAELARATCDDPTGPGCPTGPTADTGEPPPPCYLDEDGDRYGGAPGSAVLPCPEGQVENDADCDDSDSTVNPDGIEQCDGIDSDCDGLPDRDLVSRGLTPFGSDLRAAIDAGGPDPVVVCPGTYPVTLLLDEDVEIQGLVGADGERPRVGRVSLTSTALAVTMRHVVVDVEASPPTDQNRAFQVSEGSTVTLEDVDLRNGVTPTVGAGLWVRNGATVVYDGGTIEGNRADERGGGVEGNGFVSVTLRGVHVVRNEAPDGAGLDFRSSGEVILEDLVIEQNTATSGGGGLLMGGTTTLMGERLEIRGNNAARGKGLFLTGGVAGLTDLVVESHSAGAAAIEIDSNFVSHDFVRGRISGNAGGGVMITAGQIVSAGVEWNGVPDNTPDVTFLFFGLPVEYDNEGCDFTCNNLACSCN